MKRLNLRWPVLALLLALPAAFMPTNANTAFAQATSSGTITGTVTDPSGAFIPGATITITDPATKSTRTTVSGKNGQFVLVDVPPGSYNVTSAKGGFSTDQILGLTVSVGTQVTANFKLAVGAESTVVNVQATNADLQTLNSTVGETVDPAVVESLPAVNRDASSFAAFQPGVTPGGNSVGTVTDQANFQLDGGSNTSDMDGNQTTYPATLGNTNNGGINSAAPSGVMPMPQDSVEEFKVSVSGQTADFNNSAGSQSSIVTKRGRDKWTGTAYEYYLDNNIGANTWQNNFPAVYGYTPKPSYHYSRYGFAAGGPVAPTFLGGKTYLFANFELFRYPNAATFERTVPSYSFMQGNFTNIANSGTTVLTPAQMKALDPRGIGQNATLLAMFNKTLPLQSADLQVNNPAYTGTFDYACNGLSSSYCDSTSTQEGNTIGYKANVNLPTKSNFFVARLDHDFGAKWHLMLSYRDFAYSTITSNQVDFGGFYPGDVKGVPTAVAPRPEHPFFFVAGLTTNISNSLTNEFHYSYLRNNWEWKDDISLNVSQVAGGGGQLEPLGESATSVLSPYNVNAQNVRTRIWNGKDNFFSDNLTKLKGDHLIQMGGSFQHNYNFHQRTDNGASINYSTTYQIGDTGSTGGNITYNNPGGLNGTGSPLTNTSSGLRLLDVYYGFVTDSQVANTYSNVGGALSLNTTPYTPIHANTTIPYYNLYATDTWHAKAGLTINYGLSYAIEMPPHERDGNQVMFTDATGNAVRIQNYLNQKKAAAMVGQVYNPEVGFALVNNVLGGRKYAYDPYYGSLSPRISAAWSPKFKNPSLAKIFGDGASVLRGGYGRIYGRINGDLQVLNPLLSPGLILAEQCSYGQNATTGTGGTGTCNQTNYNDTTAFRIGTDGLTAPLASAPSTIAQPYHPGYDGPGVAIASPLDPSVRPDVSDTFNLSFQRQVNRKMLVEVGYIGRFIHNELVDLNPNNVPYMMTLGGQTFASAYEAVEGAFGCATSASLCLKSTTPTNVPMQPFFEAALGGQGSAYCGTTTCTAAVVKKLATQFRGQQVFSIWQALDNPNLGVAPTPGFTFGRSLMGTAIAGQSYGGNGQIANGMTIGASSGHSNYQGGYLSFKTTNYKGITLQENLTYSKALGDYAYNQSTSSTVLDDSFNPQLNYGVQSFNQKLIFNTFIVYQIPYYKEQHGILGRALGGWTLAPVVTAGTGQPLGCGTNSGGQSFGGASGTSQLSDLGNCVFQQKYTGAYQTHRGVVGSLSTDGLGVKVGTTVHNGATASSAINIFSNPAAIFATVRPAILGLDNWRNGGAGPINGLPYLNVDMSIKKKIVVYNKASVELTGVLLNAMNHLDFAYPAIGITTSAAGSFGVVKSQGNNPRQIQVGVRVSY